MLELFRDNLVQLVVFAVVAGYVLYLLGFIKLGGFSDIDSLQTECSGQGCGRKFDTMFENFAPESEYLMVERGGRKDWRDTVFGGTGYERSGLGEGVQAPIDKSLGKAKPLTGPVVPQLFTSTGDHLIREGGCDMYL
jgi:hypothetical protein